MKTVLVSMIVGMLMGAGSMYLFAPTAGPVAVQAQSKAKTQQESASQAMTAQASAPVVPTACQDFDYVVLDGDNLSWIAKKEYNGRTYLWRLIAERNGITAPYKIYPDKQLVIPCSICNLPQLKQVPSEPKKSTKTTTTIHQPVSVPQTVPTPVQQNVVVEQKQTQAEAQPVQVNTKNQIAEQLTVHLTVNNEKPASPVPAVHVEAPPPLTSQPAPSPVVANVKPMPPTPGPTVNVTKPPEITPPPAINAVPSPTPMLVGAAWNSLVQTPLEKGNFVDYAHADLGVILFQGGGWQLMPYVAINKTTDTKGYAWDNRIEGEGGVKVIRAFSHGMFDFGVAGAEERRSAGTRGGLIGFTQGWFGWQQPTRQEDKKKKLFSAAPGSTWWSIGNTSPFERGNVIGMAKIEQGVTLVKVAGISFIPDATLQMGFDTKGNPWNRRWIAGGGLKVAVPWKTGVLDFQAGYQCAREYSGPSAVVGTSGCGPAFSINFWSGLRTKLGGR